MGEKGGGTRGIRPAGADESKAGEGQAPEAGAAATRSTGALPDPGGGAAAPHPPHRTPHPAASPAAWLPQPSPPPDSVNTHHVSDPIRDAARSGPGVRGKPCITGLRPPTGGHRSWGSESVKGCTWSHQRGNLRSREACPATKVRLQRGARREIDGEP